MPEDKPKSDEAQAFKVRDRRGFTSEGEPKEEASPKEVQESKAEAPGSLPEIDFGTFLLSLSTSALVNLGEAADPQTGQPIEPDYLLAKQTIDIIGLLKEKTKGNLTSEEQNLIEHLLYDLRMRYIQKTR